ncbi:MAG TPA: inorganic diphosphatase [Chitinophagaceae bacterium]|nr:inorganic diphosphatase [Chitinophagaceae bacterium]
MKKKSKNEKKEDCFEIIIETPRGSRNKYKYNEKKEIFTLHKILPAGFSFPFDFGFIPGTKAEDGDPLDIMLIAQQSTFPGCRVDCRIIGGIKAKQKEDEKKVRNDRLFAVPVCDEMYAPVQNTQDLSKELIDEIVNFFIAYRKYENVEFVPLSLLNAEEAKKIIKSS